MVEIDRVSNLRVGLNTVVSGMCPEEMVQLSDLVELPVAELTVSNCVRNFVCVLSMCPCTVYPA